MFNSAVLEMAIGLMYLYALLALVNSAIVEMLITYVGNLRARTFVRIVERMFDPANQKANRDRISEFFAHPLVASMSSKAGKKPSYLAPATFATAFVDVACKGSLAYSAARANLDKGCDVLDAALASIESLDIGGKAISNPLYRPLKTIADNVKLAERDFDRQIVAFQAGIEQWFREVSDRAGGWLKRKSQVVSVLTAALLCIASNADTFDIAQRLSLNPQLRDNIVKAAGERSANGGTDSGPSAADEAGKCRKSADISDASAETEAGVSSVTLTQDQYNKLQACLQDVGRTEFAAATSAFSLGWSRPVPTSGTEFAAAWQEVATFKKGAGLFISTIAVSLGAAFWFRLIGAALRLTGRTPGEAEKDAQAQLKTAAATIATVSR